MNSNLNSSIRLVLTAVGTILVTLGVVSPTEWGTILPAAMDIVGVILPAVSYAWSVYENRQGNKQVVAALNSPKPATEVTLATLPQHTDALAVAAQQVK